MEQHDPLFTAFKSGFEAHRDANEWPRPIPVSERLPEFTKLPKNPEHYTDIYSDDVLVLLQAKSYPASLPQRPNEWAIGWLTKDMDGTTRWGFDEEDREFDFTVTHWLALPPPPTDPQ